MSSFRLPALILGLGMLGSAACGDCGEPPADTSSGFAEPKSATCGSGTVFDKKKRQCVAKNDAQDESRGNDKSDRSKTLTATGNN